MEELAEASGLSKATLYYYFTGKEDILAWLLRRTLAEVEQAVGAAAKGSGLACDRLADAVRALLDVMAKHPAASCALFLELRRAGSMPEVNAALLASFHVHVVNILQDGAHDGSITRRDEPMAVATILWGAVIIPGLQLLLLGSPIDPDELARPILNLVLDGLRPRP